MPLVNPPQSTLQYIDTTTGKPTPNVGMQFLTKITNALNGTPNGTQPAVAAGIKQITLGNGINISSGAGSPQSVVPGNPGDLYSNTSGGAGTTFWVKESGVGTKSGWVSK